MQSESTSVIPPSLCAYAWKGATTSFGRPVLARNEDHGDSDRAGVRLQPVKVDASVSWKAYLACRDFQNLASDLAEAFFSPASKPTTPDVERSQTLVFGTSSPQISGIRPLAGLLSPVLQDEPASDGHPLELAIAA